MAAYRTYILSAAVLVGGIVLPSVVHAQQIPSTAEPGIITRDLGEERRTPSRLGDIIRLEDTDISGDLSTEKVFTLEQVSLEGSTVYTQQDINRILAEYIGQEVSFADLTAMSVQLTRQYRADGYMFSRVFLPPQEIEGGIVRLEALEGHLTEVEVVGDYKDENGLIQDFANKLKAEGPTNSKDLERYLLLIDDLPGIKARSVLEQSDTVGGGKIIITIEQDEFEGSAAIDNRGSRFLGQGRGTLVGAFNSLFGIHDRTTLRGIVTRDTEELRFFDLMHEEQIGSEGMRLKGRFAVTNTEPGYSLKPINVEGDSRLYDLEDLYPVIRSRQYNFNLIGGFTAINSESDISSVSVSEDKVRYLRVGGEFDFTDALAGVTQLDFEVAKGVNWFSATKDGAGRTRTNGEHDFLRSNVSVTRIQDLPGDFSVQISGEGQYTTDSLLASEEFSIGGEGVGRAYDSGEITGDRGVAGAVELRYSGPVPHDFVKSYQLYGYYDAGKVWNERPAVTENSDDSLASAGVGVRFNVDYDVSGYVEFDKPLTRPVNAEGDEDSRLFFSLLKRF